MFEWANSLKQFFERNMSGSGSSFTLSESSATDTVWLQSESQQLLRYRVSFTALALLIALSPIWLCWSIFAVYSMGSEFFRNFMQVQCLIYILPIFFYAALITVGCLALKVCSDTRLAINSKSIRLPWQFLFDAKFCLERPWQSLESVNFQVDHAIFVGVPQSLREQKSIRQKHPDKIVLGFNDGASIALVFKGLSSAHLKDFILAMQTFAPQVIFKPSLAEVNLNFGSYAPAQSLHASFTQLWEEELDNRFGSTIFVPLEAGQILVREGGLSLKIQGQLSFGGLSAVYLVSREILNEAANSGKPQKLFVLKEAVLPVNSDDALKQKALAMFERESRLLSALNHPRIAKVIDFFVANGRNYILLEHIEGVDLRRFVKENGKQDAAVAIRWLTETASILQYLHGQNPPIIHRDVTPDNLVLARDGRLTLIDFGAANALVGTATGTLVGKQSYIAPEQFRGKANFSSDIYSLGATIFFALTACDPEPLRTLHPAEITEIPPALDQLIAHCTEQEQEMRIGSLEQLLERAKECGAS